MRKVEFEVNFSVKLYASLTRGDLAYLQITCPYVYYLKYTELKKSLDSQTGVLPSKSCWKRLWLDTYKPLPQRCSVEMQLWNIYKFLQKHITFISQ